MPKAPLDGQLVESLRTNLRGSETLHDIHRCLGVLRTGYEVIPQQDGSHVSVPLSATRVTALGTVLRTQLKLLDKVLPDLKAIEVSEVNASNGTPVSGRLRSMGSIEKAARLVQFLNQAAEDARNPPIEAHREPEPPDATDPADSGLPDFLKS